MHRLAFLAIIISAGCGSREPQPVVPTPDPRVAVLQADVARLTALANTNYAAAKRAEGEAEAAELRASRLERVIEPAQRAAVGRYIDAADRDNYVRALGSIPQSQWRRIEPLAQGAAAGEMLGIDDWVRLNRALDNSSVPVGLWIAAATDWAGIPEGLQPEAARISAARNYLAAHDAEGRAAAQFEANAELIEEAGVIQPASAFVK